MDFFNVFALFLSTILMNQGVETEHNGRRGVEYLVDNMPKQRDRCAEQNFRKLNPIAVATKAKLPDFKLNIRLNPTLFPLSIKQKNDSLKVSANSEWKPEPVKPRVLADDPKWIKQNVMSLSATNENGNVNFMIPKEPETNRQRKTIEIFERPIDIPAQNKTDDVKITRNIPKVVPNAVKREHVKVNVINKSENKTAKENEKVIANIEQPKLNVSKNYNYKNTSDTTENITKIKNIKKSIDHNKENKTMVKEHLMIPDVIPTKDNQAINTNRKILNITEHSLARSEIIDKLEEHEVQPKKLATNDNKKYLTIRNRNYNEIIGKFSYVDRTWASITPEENPVNAFIVCPSRAWSTDRDNFNQIFGMSEADPNIDDILKPQSDSAYNEPYSFGIDDKELWSYPRENNNYFVWKSWTDTDISIDSNSKPYQNTQRDSDA